MLVTLEEAKTYLRVDSSEDDGLIEQIIQTSEKLCADIARLDETEIIKEAASTKLAVFYAIAYLYEHREEADHHALTLSLRSLLFGVRKEEF